MSSFSLRKGLKTAPSIQSDSLEKSTRNRLWSFIYLVLLKDLDPYNDDTSHCDRYGMAVGLWHNNFRQPLDQLPHRWSDFTENLRSRFFSISWHEAYSLMEDIIKYFPKGKDDHEGKAQLESLQALLSKVLEEDNAPYRFVVGKVIDLSDDASTQSIADSIEQINFHGASVHIKKSIELLYDRKTPDYENSIKEAISAVESACRDLTGDQNATLTSAIKNINIHPALRDALAKLYGYAGDHSGIRHATKVDSASGKPSKSQAQLILCTCAAMVNFMAANA